MNKIILKKIIYTYHQIVKNFVSYFNRNNIKKDLLNNFIKKPPNICKVCTHYDNISSLGSPEWKYKINNAPKIIHQ